MLRKSARWTLLLEGDRLVASAGADELYLIDELDAAGARALFAAWQDDALDRLDAALAPVLDKLARLGVVTRGRIPPASPLRFAVRGAPDGFAAILDAMLPEGVERVADADGSGADLLVWIRTQTSLLDTLGDYAAVRVPHLLVDLAYHHTLSIGPLVWPGETACLGCFGGRIRHLWGDPTPPAAPRALGAVPLAASLVQTELDVFRERGSCPALVERAVVLDLETLTTRAERVHRLPWCPFCFPPGAEHGAGSFALPWAAP